MSEVFSEVLNPQFDSRFVSHSRISYDSRYIHPHRFHVKIHTIETPTCPRQGWQTPDISMSHLVYEDDHRMTFIPAACSRNFLLLVVVCWRLRSITKWWISYDSNGDSCPGDRRVEDTTIPKESACINVGKRLHTTRNMILTWSEPGQNLVRTHRQVRNVFNSNADLSRILDWLPQSYSCLWDQIPTKFRYFHALDSEMEHFLDFRFNHGNKMNIPLHFNCSDDLSESKNNRFWLLLSHSSSMACPSHPVPNLL